MELLEAWAHAIGDDGVVLASLPVVMVKDGLAVWNLNGWTFPVPAAKVRAFSVTYMDGTTVQINRDGEGGLR
jgi:hypothetical protein